VKKIAVLITSYNRVTTTLECFKNLFCVYLPAAYSLDVYLVDDGSSDGTSDAIKSQFPQVNIIHGNGNLYWNRGMHLAWDTASKANDYDFYLWLNDDALLDHFALEELIDCYLSKKNEGKHESIIVGSCRESNDDNNFSYGGRNDTGPVIPNGKIQECKYINGNVVLVSKEVFEVLGNLSYEYTHAFGDYDYGLRGLRSGIKCYTTTRFVAVCPRNKSAGWDSPETPLAKRVKLLHSPKGLNIREYIIFRKKFWGWKWITFAIKAYLKVLTPNLYAKLRVIFITPRNSRTSLKNKSGVS